MSRAILKDTAWGLLGEMSARLSKIALMVLMARLLGAAEIGQFNYAMAQAGLFTVFFDFGVMTVAVREMARKPEDSTFRLYGCVKLLGCATGIVAIAIAALAFQMPQEDRFLMAGLGTYQALNDLSTFVFASYRARSEAWREARWRTISSLLQLATCVLVLLMGLHIHSVALALVGTAALSLAPLIGEAQRRWPQPGTPVLQPGRFMPAVRQCMPIAGMVLVGTLYTNLDVVVLGNYVSKEEIGWYSVVVKMIFGPLIMPMHYFQLATLPVFSAQLTDASTLAQMRHHWLRGYVLSTTAGGVLILATVNSSDWLISLLFGSQFAAAAPILGIFGMIGFLFYLYMPLMQKLLLLEKQHLTFYFQVLTLGVNAAAIFLFIPTQGVWGAVLAGGVTHATMTVAHFLCVWRISGFTRHDRGWWSILRVTVGLTVAVVITYLCRDFSWSWLASVAAFLICAHRETYSLLQHLYSRTLSRSALQQSFH